MIVTFGAASLGSATYLRSGHLKEPATRRLALLLSPAAILGTPIGVLANGYVSVHAFAGLLGVCLITVGALLTIHRWRRSRWGAPISRSRIFTIGALVAAVSGLFGLGGQILSVPLLTLAGVPALSALSSAQVQSVVIAGVGAVGYAGRGDISWHLAVLTSVPVFLGALMGSRLARTQSDHHLGFALIAALFCLGTYLLVHSIWTSRTPEALGSASPETKPSSDAGVRRDPRPGGCYTWTPGCGVCSALRSNKGEANMARSRRTKAANSRASASTAEFKCPECGKAFSRAASLGAHRNRAHAVVGASKRRNRSTTATTTHTAVRRDRRATRRSGSNQAATATRTRPQRNGGSVDRNQLLQAVFPNGVPPREDVIRRIGSWLDEAEQLAKL